MANEAVDTLVVGGGQAGLAMSEHLTSRGIEHLVLERHRIAERWRTERWDSLVANGPAWHDRFPTLEFTGTDPNGFASKTSVVGYLEDYAQTIKAPVRTGIEVQKVERFGGQGKFRATTSDGVIDAHNIVAATGPFQKPIMPPIVPKKAGIAQLHSKFYRNPGQLADGAVLVIGAGSSGVQIASELLAAGRNVYLSVGPHHRPPRRYRGYDYVWWLGVLGKWDAPAVEPGMEHVTISVSGAHGGHTIDFRNLAAAGMTLLGMTESYSNGIMTFAGDLAQNIAQGDKNYLSVLDQADAYIERHQLGLPEEPEARHFRPDPECVANPIRSLDLAEAGINTIIWATGYQLDFSWLQIDSFDDLGRPLHHRGIAHEPGVYFLGLPWLATRGSSFLYGVWHDALFIADHIKKQQGYRVYPPLA